MFGCHPNYYATILKLDPSHLSWVQVGTMTRARAAHGASNVRGEDVGRFCVKHLSTHLCFYLQQPVHNSRVNLTIVYCFIML